MSSYSNSALWADIKPIPLSDDLLSDDANAVQPLATIAYTPKYSEAMAYLRAVMAANEFSERALGLTADVISMNPAHYTVWMYRARIVRELGKDIRKELAWLDGVAKRALKGYQVWHQRQILMDMLPSLPATEPDFLTSVLAIDAKNYHVWVYRQWLCTRFPDAMLRNPDELKRTETLIDEDIRNNSAWNHRWFLVFGADDLAASEGSMGGLKALGLGGKNRVVDEELVEREVNYAMGKIRKAPQNPSAWVYLRGVLRRAGRDIGEREIEEFCLCFIRIDGDVWSAGEGGVRSSHAIEWLGEIWGARGELERAGQCWDALGQKWDPVRKAYWDYRRGVLERAAVEGVRGKSAAMAGA